MRKAFGGFTCRKCRECRFLGENQIPTLPILPTCESRSRCLVRKCPEESGALVGIAPLRAEGGAAERVLGGGPHRRIVNGRERMEPLLPSARRVVRQFLRDRQTERCRGDSKRLAVVHELNRRRGYCDDGVDDAV